jgi:hypothetical protein
MRVMRRPISREPTYPHPQSSCLSVHMSRGYGEQASALWHGVLRACVMRCHVSVTLTWKDYYVVMFALIHHHGNSIGCVCYCMHMLLCVIFVIFESSAIYHFGTLFMLCCLHLGAMGCFCNYIIRMCAGVRYLSPLYAYFLVLPGVCYV